MRPVGPLSSHPGNVKILNGLLHHYALNSNSSPPNEPSILEADVPFSESLIHRHQRDYYARRGLKAWTEDMVPSYITNNPFTAEIHAGIVAGFLSDCLAHTQKDSRPISPENPLRIVELGAGTGKFSYLFLRKLTELLRTKKIAPEIVRYRMSDCSEGLIAYWRANRNLAEFVDAGILEFELCGDAAESTASSAGNADSHDVQQARNPAFGQQTGPLVVIANYVFDSLPQDAFAIADGKISELLVTTTGPAADENREQAGAFHISYKNAPVPAGRYANQLWNGILEQYCSRVSAATVLFPVAALSALQQLSQSCDGRMLVLAADKGDAYEDQLLLRQGPPTLEFHANGQCFSQMVNFDALAKYYAAIGGEALLPPKHFTSLSICAFLQRRPGDDFPATRPAYERSLAEFGPDDLFALMIWLNAHLEEISVLQALAVLRLTRWDPTAFGRLFPVIARQLRNVTAERTDLRDAVLRTWANHYPVSPTENVIAFHCGVILLELRYFTDALAMFKTSQSLFGPSAATSYNLGLCALGLGRSGDALTFVSEAYNLDPTFEPASRLRLKLESENPPG